MSLNLQQNISIELIIILESNSSQDAFNIVVHIGYNVQYKYNVLYLVSFDNNNIIIIFDSSILFRHREKSDRCLSGYLGDRVQRPMKESQENQQNAETQRERYYATIHKVALQQANTGGGPDKIPGEPLLRYGRPPGLVL